MNPLRGSVILLVTLALRAQMVIGGAGYAPPLPVRVAPGQIITVYLKTSTDPGPLGSLYASGLPLPTVLDGYTVLLREGFGLPAPLQVPLFSVTKDTAGGLGGNWLIGPARAGEVLVAYVVGLGLPENPPPTGAPATKPVPIAMTVGYQYGANAQPTPPLTAPVSVLTPLYLGLSPGSVGLYQLNFAVPSPPPGTPACSSTVQSNLTVSVVGVDSSDAAAICVTP